MKKILSQRGFSLIELLVVIAIIAILTAIVTSNFASSKAKSRDAKRISDIAQIQLAFSLFFDRCNAYPGGLLTSSTAPAGYCLKSDGTNVTLGDYLSVVPKESPTESYGYAKPTSINVPVTNYILRAKLETISTVLNDDIDTMPSGLTNLSGGCTDNSSGYYYCVAPY